MTPQISKPYRANATSWRCKIKDPTWRWLKESTADSEAESLRLAQEHVGALERGESPAPQEEVVVAEPAPTPQVQVPTGPRLQGPHPHEGGYRYRVITSSGRGWATTGRTKAEALRLGEKLLATIAQQGSITIRDSIDALVEHKRQNGARPPTLEGTLRGLTVYFAGMLDSTISRVTPQRAQSQYDALRQIIDPRSGKLLSVDTTRCYLKHAKLWARWVVKRGWMRGPSPIDDVVGIGKKRRGKPQLTRDEGNRLGAVCLLEESEAGAAVLMCMLQGLRASEVLSRVVRDIDRGGEYLRVDDNEQVAFRVKNDSSRRPVLIPQLLRPLLANLAQGKEPTDPLFPGGLGGRKRRQWLNVEVERLCQKAGVPVVCPHSLRGWMASSAVAAGALPELVAKDIGHTSAKMTLAHYVAPGVAEAAQLARGQAAFAASQTAPLPS